MLMQIFNRIEYMMEGIELEANDLKMYGNFYLFCNCSQVFRGAKLEILIHWCQLITYGLF